MEYVVIRPPVKSVTHPETILAHYVVTRTRIREVINAYYNSKFIVKDEYPPLGVFKVIVGKRKARTFVEAAQLATEVVYTYSVSEWRHIIDLRYFGKTGAPHPNAKIIAGMIKDKLEEHGYDFG